MSTQLSSIDQKMRLAVQHHEAGRFAEAEAIYRQIVATHPNVAQAQYLLGMIALQFGHFDDAINLISKAIAIKPGDAVYHLNLGHALTNRGRTDQAVAAYSNAIRLRPDAFEAHNGLGNALKDQGKFAQAAAACAQAIKLKPDFAQAYNNLGNALSPQGKLDEAARAYLHAISIFPAFGVAYNNLCLVYVAHGRLDDAIAVATKAVQLMPNDPGHYLNRGTVLLDQEKLIEAVVDFKKSIELRSDIAIAHSNMGKALLQLGKPEESAACCREAIRLQPNLAAAYVSLGAALEQLGQKASALLAYQNALRLDPDSVEAHSNLGNVFLKEEKFDEAEAAYRKAIAIKPSYAPAHSNLGGALRERGLLDDAAAACKTAISLKPDFANAHNNLGMVMVDQGNIEAAVQAYRNALSFGKAGSDFTRAQHHSALIYTLHLHPDFEEATVVEETQRWSRQHAEPLRATIKPHSNDRSPDRKLKIGYVSTDFSSHPVGRFIQPILEHHDRQNFEIHLFSNVKKPDAATELFRHMADGLHDIQHLDDSAAADLIRSLSIDILIDLGQHTGDNRLLVFAHKPAPVQATYLGYPGTTGLKTIDYRITDAQADPPETADEFYSEKLIRLPATAWCFRPPANAPPVADAPAVKLAYVTFGSFNNFAKVSEPQMKLWANILRAVPDSKLLMKTKSLSSSTVQQHVRNTMATSGVDPDRIELRGWASPGGHLQAYGEIDIALDTYPYHGTTTTCEALWMGVPVVTQAGHSQVSRVGVSMLSCLGLPELIARTPEQYVQIAIDLAHHFPRLVELRQSMRDRMRASPLMNETQFTLDLESAYRLMWNAWCSTAPIG